MDIEGKKSSSTSSTNSGIVKDQEMTMFINNMVENIMPTIQEDVKMSPDNKATNNKENNTQDKNQENLYSSEKKSSVENPEVYDMQKEASQHKIQNQSKQSIIEITKIDNTNGVTINSKIQLNGINMQKRQDNKRVFLVKNVKKQFIINKKRPLNTHINKENDPSLNEDEPDVSKKLKCSDNVDNGIDAQVVSMQIPEQKTKNEDNSKFSRAPLKKLQENNSFGSQSLGSLMENCKKVIPRIERDKIKFLEEQKKQQAEQLKNEEKKGNVFKLELQTICNQNI